MTLRDAADVIAAHTVREGVQERLLMVLLKALHLPGCTNPAGAVPHHFRMPKCMHPHAFQVFLVEGP